jgi:pimeloyl-ACP methyl ester carboxylesterase
VVTRQNDVLGYDLVGSGSRKVIVLNDWMCDTSTWDAARVYLDGERFSWTFADLRGYGRSRGLSGSFTLVEATTDVLALADSLNWARFAIVGHSMSALIALHLSQHCADRVERAVLVTPPPPRGFGADEERMEMSRALARSDRSTRIAVLRDRFGDRLSNGWATFKASRWHEAADPVAAAAYVALFARDGVPEPTVKVSIPVLAITGERDVPPMQRDAVVRNLTPICDRLNVVSLAESGHYPMQEMPPMTAALVERFLGADSD